MKSDPTYWSLTIGRRAQPTIAKCVGVDCTALQFHVTGGHLLVETYMLAHCKGWFVVIDLSAPKNFGTLSSEELRELYFNSFDEHAPEKWTDTDFWNALHKAALDVQACGWTQAQLNQIYDSRRAREAAALALVPRAQTSMPIARVARASAPTTGAGCGNPTAQARPKAGSTTGRVWELCDIARSKAGTVADWKTFKKAILAQCSKEGINESTGSVQFGKWKINIGI